MTKKARKVNLLTKIAYRVVGRLRQLSMLPIKHQYDFFFIMLPASHMLPEYRKIHPRYDRFLPHLVKYVTSPDTVIDIGANVGDTLAGMVEQNSTLSYICIEPDDFFYRYLEDNVKRIQASVNGIKIQTIKSLVGQNITNVSLDGKGGTKHAVIGNDGSIKSLPLYRLISDDCSIRVLKSDVDGFDYDVLDSSMTLLDKHKPIIFFECQYDYEYQLFGYFETLKSLSSAGYCDWTVFDNFGDIVVRTDDLGIIMQLMRYVWQQNIGCATRTIYYFDILAVHKNDSALIDKVLSEYN